MKEFRYIDGTATLKLDSERCVGCGMCTVVCPHRIFAVKEKKAEIQDFDACMECGACALNCPVQAIAVNPGVGCADYIIATWLAKIRGKPVKTGCC